MPERICKHAGFYAGRQVEVGDRFRVDQADVELMTMAGLIEVDEPSKDVTAARPASYQTCDMTAQPREKRPYSRKAA